MSYECIKCGGETRMNVLAGISAPAALSNKLSKAALRSKEVWLTHVNWETADYICTNPKCGQITNGYGNYVTRMEAELSALKDVLKVAVPNLIKVSRMPNIEHVADGHNDAVKALAALLDK